MNLPMKKDWRFYLGMILFILSWSGVVFSIIAPMLGVDLKKAVAIVSVVLINSELAFLASIALLGKPFLQFIKNKAVSLFKLAIPKELQDVRRIRHYFGLTLFVLSFISYYMVVVVVFLDLPPRQVKIIVLSIMIGCEILFYASLFILGGKFWAKIKSLFAFD